MLLHPGPFLDVPRGVQHLQFGDAADADQCPCHERFQFLADGRQVEPGVQARLERCGPPPSGQSVQLPCNLTRAGYDSGPAEA